MPTKMQELGVRVTDSALDVLVASETRGGRGKIEAKLEVVYRIFREDNADSGKGVVLPQSQLFFIRFPIFF